MKPTLTMILSTAALVLAAGLARAQGGRLQPGQYTFSSETRIEGRKGAMPSKTSQHCITEADVKDDQRMAAMGNKDCEMSGFKKSGNRMTWSVVCQQYSSKGNGEMTFRPDGFDMMLNMEMADSQHGTMKMHFHTAAKRTGNCPK